MTTSKSVASQASKQFRTDPDPKERMVAASDLAQAKSKRKSRKAKKR